MNRLRGAGARAVDVAGRARRAVAGPLRRLLLGHDTAVSALVVLLAPVLALLGWWAVASTGGYGALAERVIGTWTGRDPSPLVPVAAALLMLGAAASAAVNSGLVPATLLAAAPVFGAGATRYGDRVVDPVLGPSVVSLPESTVFAGTVALLVGVPIGVAGFLLGAAVRRVARAVGHGGVRPGATDGA